MTPKSRNYIFAVFGTAITARALTFFKAVTFFTRASSLACSDDIPLSEELSFVSFTKTNITHQ